MKKNKCRPIGLVDSTNGTSVKYESRIYKNGEIRVISDCLKSVKCTCFYNENFVKTIVANCEKIIYLCKTSINSPPDSSYNPTR